MDLPVPSGENPDESEPPPLFGRYRPLRELGRGGMGVVLLAHDNLLGVDVALKLVPDAVVRDTEGIADLKKEVLRGMELTHPGIVRMFNFEQDENAAVIVMEYIQGETLAQAKAQKASRCFDCENVRPWLEQLTTVLDYAHREARIAHRDLKPGNIMVTATGRLKVTDFGIAASLSDTMSRVSVRVDTSGTPPYMSPQQAMGERPTHLDDIYSLGATFYELLTGKPPFFRGNILAQVLHEEPVPMARRRLELGVSGCAPIPAVWEKMIAACLAKTPDARPHSGAEVLALLTNPESVLLGHRPNPVGEAHLEPRSQAEPIQRVVPRPMPAINTRHEAAKDSHWPRLPQSIFRRIVSAVTAVFQESAAVMGTVIGFLLKLALVVAVVWGLLIARQKWADGQAEKKAIAAKQAAAMKGPEPAPPPIARPAPASGSLSPPGSLDRPSGQGPFGERRQASPPKR